MATDPATTRTAIIAGGGIGGLAAAIGLRSVGWTVTVLERTPEKREIGAGWSFAPNGVRAAETLGLGEALRACSVPTQAAATVFRPSGTPLMAFRPDHDTPLLASHRADLHQALYDRLPPGTVHTGAEVTDVVQSAAGVTVTWLTREGPRRSTARVLIGADGIRSSVRRAVRPEAPSPVFQRILCWRGVTEPGAVEGVTGFQTWGRGARLGAHPIGGKRVFWFLAIRQATPNTRYGNEIAEVRRRIGDWHDPIPALLDATPRASLLRHDVYDLDPLESYVSGRVALLGDAAHAMTPFLAQGACQALEDAVVLAAELGRGDGRDVVAALKRYDAVRRPRSQRVRRMARKDPRISLSTRRVTYDAMTGLTRMASGGLAQRKAARLWRWTPPELALAAAEHA